MRRNILGSDIFQNALLFGVPITAVVSAIFFGMNFYQIGQIDKLVKTELEDATFAIVQRYESEGADFLIQDQIERDGEIIWSDLTAFRFLTSRDIVFGLFDDDGQLIAGYQEFFGIDNYDVAGFFINDVYFEIAVITTHFENGHKIGVGRMIDPRRDELVALIEEWKYLVPAITYFICLLLGAILDRRVQARVTQMASTASAATQENLTQFPELPMRGDEFDQLVVTFNQMTRRLQRLAENVEATSVGIAHDLRTPLTNIAGRLELMRDDLNDPDAIAAHIESADEAQSELLSMLDALLRLGEIRSGKRKKFFVKVELSNVIARMCEAYEPGFEQHRKSFRTEVSPNITTAGDRELIEMMVSNLLENAIKHSRVGAKVFVTLVAEDKKAILTVGDDGPGISPIHRGRVFDRFFRAEQSRTTAGSGLGLSIVKAISELHDAEVEILENQPGTVFQLKFCCVMDEEAQSDAA